MINTDYPQFTRSLYESNPGLVDASFEKQLEVRDASLFGTSDFYPRRLRELGHDAMEVHFNNLMMQHAWAKEASVARLAKYRAQLPLQRLQNQWELWGMQEILLQQVRQYKPDVVLCHDMQLGSRRFFARLKKLSPMLILQIACPLDWSADFSHYDLIISSLPGFVDRFRSMGHEAELFRLGFDPLVLDRVPAVSRDVDVSFIGSLSLAHPARIVWLEKLCEALPVKIWGNEVEKLPAGSAIRKAHQGTVWGKAMYEVMMRSRITLNCHIDIAGRYANNMRLYEATGCGACLVTDHKDNMSDIFEPGSEVVTYRDTDDCIRQVRDLLDDDARLSRIASQGQARTLASHTYAQRMAQLVQIVTQRLS